MSVYNKPDIKPRLGNNTPSYIHRKMIVYLVSRIIRHYPFVDFRKPDNFQLNLRYIYSGTHHKIRSTIF